MTKINLNFPKLEIRWQVQLQFLLTQSFSWIFLQIILYAELYVSEALFPHFDCLCYLVLTRIIIHGLMNRRRLVWNLSH